MSKFQVSLACLLMRSTLVGCNDQSYQDGRQVEDCIYYRNMSDDMVLNMTDANLRGDTKSYSWAKESYDNVQRYLLENCS